MSFQAIRWALQQDLPTGPKLVLVLLADLVDENGRCYPGVGYLARNAGCSPRAVYNYNNFLIRTGWIARAGQGRDKSGQHNVKMLRLHLPAEVLQSLRRRSKGNVNGGSAPRVEAGADSPAESVGGRAAILARDRANIGDGPSATPSAKPPADSATYPINQDNPSRAREGGASQSRPADGSAAPVASEIEERWGATLARLEQLLGKQVMASWITPLRPRAVVSGVLELSAPSEFFRVEILQRYERQIVNAWGGPVRIVHLPSARAGAARADHG